METFLTIFTIILLILTISMLNLVVYNSIKDLIEDLPKWLKRLLLFPPLPIVATLVIAMIFSATYIVENVKKYW